jgi:hypothetical protein
MGVLDGGERPSAFQDVGQTSGEHHQPSRLSRCGEARHDSQSELASHPPKDDAWKQAHVAMLVRLGKGAHTFCETS